MADDERDAAEAAKERAETGEKRRRRWGCLVYVGIALLLPVAILAGVGSILVALDAQELAEAERRARDAGDPLTPEEMQALYQGSPENEAATKQWLEALEATQPISEQWRSLNVPLLGPSDLKETLDARGLYDEATLARVEPFLEGGGAEALRLTHAARESARDVEYPIDFEKGWMASRETIVRARTTANLLVLEAEARAARGDTHRATEGLLTLIAVSESLARAPDAVAYAIRTALVGVAVDAAMRLIDRTEFSSDDLKRLEEAFARQAFRPQMICAAQGEQFSVLQFYRSDEPTGDANYDSLRAMPLRGADRAMALQWGREFVQGASESLAAADAAAQNIEANVEALREKRWERFRYTIAAQTAYSFGSLVNGALRIEAECRMARACCACERYRQERGEWPSSLSDLVPQYLSAVPLDPADDQPLRYKVDGERMIIHSLVHFRPENSPDARPMEEGIACHVLGEPYVPPPPPAQFPADPYLIE